MNNSGCPSARQTLIDSRAPANWRELEERVGQVLDECGFEVEVGATTKSARGSVEFDVCARDSAAALSTLVVVECKMWERAVSQGEVHRFRTTVADVGASVGFLVSAGGFQSGAHEAAAFTNVRLVTWEEFQSTFAERWYQNYMLSVIRAESRRLIDCSATHGFFLFELFGQPQQVHQKAMELSAKYDTLADIAWTLLWFKGAIAHGAPPIPQLPLRSSALEHHRRWSSLPHDILDASALRPLLTALVNHFRHAISDFDDVLVG